MIFLTAGREKMDKYLITGGAGFIGTNFVKSILNKDNKVIILDSIEYSGNPENFKDIIKYVYYKDKSNKFKIGEEFSVIRKKIFEKKIKEKECNIKRKLKSFYNNNENLLFIKGNLLDSELINDLTDDIDYIVHFAAETHVDRSIIFPERFIFSDIVGTFVLYNTIKEKKFKKIIHISTDEIYGPALDKSFDEESILMPTNPYSASKAAADRIAFSYFKMFNLPIVIARPSNNYGPYQFPEKFIPLITIKCLNNEEMPLYGDGRQIRDWLFVEDTCYGIKLLLEKGIPGEVYNISGRTEKENIEIARKVCKILGKPESLIKYVKDRPCHDRRYSMEDRKIRELGFENKTRFEEGLEKTVLWYKENKEWWEDIIKRNKEFKIFYNKWYLKR